MRRSCERPVGIKTVTYMQMYMVLLQNTTPFGGAGDVSGQKVLDNINRGMYGNIFTFTFDEKGLLNFTHPRPSNQ